MANWLLLLGAFAFVVLLFAVELAIDAWRHR